jgi:CDP-diacylglycerol--glycerol-3-phosphate 3-phosphatidyltransferase/CDP-diacylglycerol--inositol 3-phosphatidyltransferase
MRASFYLKKISDRVVIPLAKVLLKLKISPDFITALGVVGTLWVSVVFIAQGEWLVGGILLFFVTSLDMVDGAMARLQNRDSIWGAFLDSVMDRISDGIILGSLIYYFYKAENTLYLILMIWALVMSEVTSYARARAEGVGLDGKIGIAERPERLGFVVWGTFLTGLGLTWMTPVMVWGLVVVSTITVGQRINYVRRQVKNLN